MDFEDFNPNLLLELLQKLDTEQALWEERAIAARKFLRICDTQFTEMEHEKQELYSLLESWEDAEQLYRTR